MCMCGSVNGSDGERKSKKEMGGCERKRHQSSLCPLWSGIPVLFLTSTKPSLLGSNQSVTLRQAGRTEWSMCISVCTCVCTCIFKCLRVYWRGGCTLSKQRRRRNRNNRVCGVKSACKERDERDSQLRKADDNLTK